MPLSLPLRYHAKLQRKQTIFEELAQAVLMLSSVHVPDACTLEFGDALVLPQGDMWKEVLNKFNRLPELGGEEFVAMNEKAFNDLDAKHDRTLRVVLIACAKQFNDKVDPALAALANALSSPKTSAFQYVQTMDKAIENLKKITLASTNDFKNLARTQPALNDPVLAPIEEAQTARREFLKCVANLTKAIAMSTIDLSEVKTQKDFSTLYHFCTKETDGAPGYDDAHLNQFYNFAYLRRRAAPDPFVSTHSDSNSITFCSKLEQGARRHMRNLVN